jgi:hypothetical protein
MENRDKRGNLLAFANEYQEGMQLRDYFAAKAMQEHINNPLNTANNETHRVIAERAYRIADAMIEARGNK